MAYYAWNMDERLCVLSTTLSKGMVKFRKAAKKKLGKKISVKLPICVSNLIVFFWSEYGMVLHGNTLHMEC